MEKRSRVFAQSIASILVFAVMSLSAGSVLSDPNAPDHSLCKEGVWSSLGFRNQGECVRIISNDGFIWSHFNDFRTSPDQENPNRDSNGNPDVWHFMASSSLVRDPNDYNLLTTFRVLVGGNSQHWDNDTGQTVPFPLAGIVRSSGKAIMHPDTSNLSIIGWKSPIDGTVIIRGGFEHAGQQCGNGVSVFVDHDTAPLLSATLPTDGVLNFGTGLSAEVIAGEFLYFVVDPTGAFPIVGEADCDSTRLELTISGPVPDDD